MGFGRSQNPVAGRIASLGATRDFHHGLLESYYVPPPSTHVSIACANPPSS